MPYLFPNFCSFQLNHEIAHNVYNRGTGIGDADSSAHPMGIDTKKDLLSRIHTKNKYIKRLLCENDSLRQQIDTLNEKNVQLDICLKQTTNRLTKANSDLLELQRQNSISADDILILNNKIREISQQMCNMEKEKVKYQTDILFLGQEIHKRVDRWNDALRHKREKEPRVQNASVSDDEGAHLIGNDLMRENIRQDLKELEKDRMEISVLSQVTIIAKRLNLLRKYSTICRAFVTSSGTLNSIDFGPNKNLLLIISFLGC